MSAVSSWRPDAALLAGARDALGAALARARTGGIDGALFEAAGRLVALGAGSLASEALATLARERAELAAAAARALEGDEAEGELEDAAVALREALRLEEEAPFARREARRLEEDGPLARREARRGQEDDVASPSAPRRGEGGGGEGALEAAVGAAFAARDRAEFRLLGAALALGSDADGLGVGVASRLAFEALVRPELWRLCALNPARRSAALAVTPALRARFWWWHEGSAIAPGAAAALPAVAALLVAFPGARSQLESLVRAGQAWAAAGAGARPAGGPVSTLRDWVERRARGAGAAEAFPMAAAAADEILVLDGADLQLSWSPPDGLIVDLLADRAPGELPALRLADGSLLEAVAVEGAEERYAFALPERALDEARARLLVPLARGPLVLVLPPDEDGDGGGEG